MAQGTEDWSDADFLLMGGIKVRSARWGAPKEETGLLPDKVPNYVEQGTVTERPESRQQTGAPGTPEAGNLLFWDDGKPKMQVVIKIQTQHREDEDDDGIRAIYVKGGELQKAIIKAVTSVGGKRVEPGGVLRVKFLRKVRENGQYKNYWAAQYELPQQVAVDDFFGTTETQQQSQGFETAGFNSAPPAASVPAQRAPESANADQARMNMLERMKAQQETGIANLQAAKAANAAHAANPPVNEWANATEPPF